jgi:hypothetical protein
MELTKIQASFFFIFFFKKSNTSRRNIAYGKGRVRSWPGLAHLLAALPDDVMGELVELLGTFHEPPLRRQAERPRQLPRLGVKGGL